jgi:hypothetical protein
VKEELDKGEQALVRCCGRLRARAGSARRWARRRWRASTQSLKLLLLITPVSYLVGRLIDCVIAVLCAVMVLHDRSLFSLPYLLAALGYVQIWAAEHGRKLMAGGGADAADPAPDRRSLLRMHKASQLAGLGLEDRARGLGVGEGDVQRARHSVPTLLRLVAQYEDAARMRWELRLDRLVAAFALLGLFGSYASENADFQAVLDGGLTRLNALSWVETTLPKWDQTSVSLWLVIIFAQPVRELLPTVRPTAHTDVLHDKLATLFSSLGSFRKLAPSPSPETPSAAPPTAASEGEAAAHEAKAIVAWLKRAFTRGAYVCTLCTWSVFSLSFFSVAAMLLACLSTVFWDGGARWWRCQLWALEGVLLGHWLLGAGVQLPFVHAHVVAEMRLETSGAQSLGLLGLVLLVEHIHSVRPDQRLLVEAWAPTKDTLGRLETAATFLRWIAFGVLLICGLTKASLIHFGYLVTCVVFISRAGGVPAAAWLALAVVAYACVTASLAYHLARPPIYENCADAVALYNAPPGAPGGASCATDLGALPSAAGTRASWLAGEALNAVCPEECCKEQGDCLDEASLSLARIDVSSIMEFVGLHACHQAQHCRCVSHDYVLNLV